MITTKHPVDLPDTHSLERIDTLRDPLFLDIETTGFSEDISQFYPIGCTYHGGLGWELAQWFADTRESEAQLLVTFSTFMERFEALVHFNGNGLNIPYLLRCCRRLGLGYNFDNIASVDIYKKIKSYRKLLGLENMKQEFIEQFLGASWEGRYSGKQLIEVYRDYLVTHGSFPYDPLILHNEDDLKGMPPILPILNCADMVGAPFTLDLQRLYYADDISGPFLNLIWRSSYSIPVSLEYDTAPMSLELHRDVLTCNIALYQGKLEYFCPNYRDYYYLPFEDTVIHKSMGEYVDKDARKRATIRTYYSRKCGLFLPQFGPLWSPYLKEDYKAPLDYAAYSPDLLSDSGSANSYTRQVLDYMNHKWEA